MVKTWQILHLTDFHIAQPEGVNEHLRRGHFREYIDGLCASLNAYLNGSSPVELDAIVLTGDFVNRGQLGNFAHVQEVMNYLCTCLAISKDRVFVCNGNHDINREKDQADDIAGARQHFVDFANGLGNRLSIFKNNRFTFSKCESGAYALMIDSTIGAAGQEKPGPIDTAEVDQIIEFVRMQGMSASDLLIVASHHPPVSQFNTDAPFDEANTRWHEKHIWSSAHSLYTRLRKVTPQLLWLSGDIHRPAYTIDGSVHAVVTGRFGGSVEQPPSQVRRQARVISIQETDSSTSWLFEYVPNGHNDHPHNGEWEMKSSPPTRHISPEPRQVPAGRDAIRSGASSDAVIRLSGSAQTEAPITRELQVLSPSLQSSIFEILKEQNLYSLGRFITSNAESTLAWIPMGALMDEEELLVRVIHEMTKWMTTLLKQENSDFPIIVGIDSWGAILASQLSVTTGVHNYCIAGRAQGSTHSSAERISNTVTAAVAKADMVILISDVIGTGKSLRHIYETLHSKMTEKQKGQAKWAVLSMICDDKHERHDTLAFTCANATACKDLRIPILQNTRLPSLEILPPDISFLRS